MEVRVSNHSVYKTQYHIVFIPKYRRRIFKNPGVRHLMHRLLYEASESIPGVEIREQNVQEDHVHMMIIIPPRYSVSEVVQRLKGVTSMIMRKKMKWLKKMYTKSGIWSTGYFVSTVGIDENIIRNYVRYQEDLDSGQAKLDLRSPGL